MYTDLELASHLLEEENKHAAGLCYVFICLPGINLVKEKVGEAASKLQSRVGVLLAGLIMGIYFVIGTAIFVALGVLLWLWPLAFRYPAVFITISIVLISMWSRSALRSKTISDHGIYHKSPINICLDLLCFEDLRFESPDSPPSPS